MTEDELTENLPGNVRRVQPVDPSGQGPDIVVSIDPAIPDGVAWVGVPGTSPGAFWTRDEFGEVVQGKAPLVGPGKFDELIKSARKPGLALDPVRVTLPLQYPTLKALTDAFEGVGRAAQQFGKAAQMMEIRNTLLFGSWTRRRERPRAVRSVPAIVPTGLSRVDSGRARAARSALLRSRRRALRHNRALPSGPRARIYITDPKITWDGVDFTPRHDRREDRLDAACFAFADRPQGG